MADISKIKIPAGTTYNMKDATARSNITKITNKTTKLAYGDELAVDGTDLKLLDPNNNVLSTVSLPGGVQPAPSVDDSTFGSTAYSARLNNGTLVTEWSFPGQNRIFNYDSALDTHAAGMNLKKLSAAVNAGEETYYVLLVPASDEYDSVNNIINTPWKHIDYSTATPTNYKLDGNSCVDWYWGTHPSAAAFYQGINDIEANAAAKAALNSFLGDITQITRSNKVAYNNHAYIQIEKLVYLKDFNTPANITRAVVGYIKNINPTNALPADMTIPNSSPYFYSPRFNSYT